jgi:tetratricopeptide (TPR) repeat protein
MNLKLWLLPVICWLFICFGIICNSAASTPGASKDSSASQPVEHLQDANTPDEQVTTESSQSGDDISTGTNIEVTPLLRHDIIKAPRRENENDKMELRRLIAQIHSIKFETKDLMPETFINREQVPEKESEPNKTDYVAKENLTNVGSPVLQSQSQVTLEPVIRSYQPVSDQTLQILEDIEQSTAGSQINKPLQLAEILFLSGHLKPAATVYRQMLTRMNPNDVASACDRAWILFQIGNCLRESDLPEAKRMYGQLIEEYPNCPWADLAGSRASLIDWYLKDKPKDLIEKSKPSN